MPPLTEMAPEVLRSRHRLSSQQINSLFGKTVIEESFEEKAKALGKVAEFIRVTDGLNAAGISFIPLKGPILSYRLYGDASFRYFSDLDLLVDASSLNSTKELLGGDGYRSYGRPWPGKSREQRRVLRYSHHISFLHPEKQTAFEIHWRLAPSTWLNFSQGGTLSTPELTSLNFEGRLFTVLNNEHELLFLIIHGGHHRWGMLKWLADVNRFMTSQEINLDKFNELVKAFNAGRLVALCNSMLSEYFPGGRLVPCSSIATDYMIRLSKKAAGDADCSGPETISEILTNMGYMVNAYPGLRYKTRLLLSTMSNSIFHGRLGGFLR